MPISMNSPSIPKPLSWNLNVDSTIIVVTSSMTIGSVMIQLVNQLGKLRDENSLNNHFLSLIFYRSITRFF